MPTAYCRHIRTNGHRCQSPALRGKVFCYYHGSINDRHRALNRPWTCAEDFNMPLHFPTIDDRESIQVALSMLISALGENRIDPKRAGRMIYGLQVASSNVGGLKVPLGTDHDIVRDIVLDETGAPIATDDDPIPVIREREYEKAFAEEEEEEDEDDDDDEDRSWR